MIHWLLSGDPAIVYQVHRDLIESDSCELVLLQKKISESGWGKRFLANYDKNTGLWGNSIYNRKWISTTYTMLDLKNLGLYPQTAEFLEGAAILIQKLWCVPVNRKERWLDLCICGMLLNLCCYAGNASEKIPEIVDFILEKQFADGGWNCRWEVDTEHSSLHTTINILEGIHEYLKNGYTYRSAELKSAQRKAHNFVLMHRLYKSDRTGEIIGRKMTMLSYPPRWKHDILRCMDYFLSANADYDDRMEDAIELILKKRKKSGFWPVQQKHSGAVHFDMEKTGQESRWNTLRILRVLKKYRNEYYIQLIGQKT